MSLASVSIFNSNCESETGADWLIINSAAFMFRIFPGFSVVIGHLFMPTRVVIPRGSKFDCKFSFRNRVGKITCSYSVN